MSAHQIRRLSENLFWKQVINPIANVVDGVYPSSSSYIDTFDYARFAFLISIGATDDTTVSAKVVQATATAGTGKKDVSGAAITTTVLAGANDNKWALIEVDQERLDIANDFSHVALEVAATGGTATIMAAFFFGIEPRVKPPTFGSDKAEIVYVDG